MGAPSETYVDPSIAANSGTGTIGDPYGDLQYALDTMTRDATNGDRINIKSGTAEILTGTISLASYGGPTSTAGLIFQGYDSVAGDGGIGVLDGNGGNFTCCTNTTAHFHKHMRFTNTGSAVCVRLGFYCKMVECEADNSTGGGIDLTGNFNAAIKCYVHNVGGVGIEGGMIHGCYIANGTNKVTNAISLDAPGLAAFNIINIDGSSNGITAGNPDFAIGNSVLSSAGTGYGIDAIGGFTFAHMRNNLVEGFSGTGGKGFLMSGDTWGLDYSGAFNNFTNYSGAADDILIDDNETLVASPFAKTGSLPTDFTSASFWSDLYAYFAPVDTGNVYSGFPVGSNQTKGAVGQPVGGGAGGGLLRVNMNGNVFG